MSADPGKDKIPDAYDVKGRPLYYHPPEGLDEAAHSPAVEAEKPQHQENKALVKLRHDRSVSEYPEYELGEDEYVEVATRRHKVGLIMIWAGEAIACVVVACLWIFMLVAKDLPISIDGKGTFYISVVAVMLLVLLLLSGWIGAMIYKGNTLVVTNKRIIQRITRGLFDHSMQTIDLVSVEDASYKQSGFVETIFGYGTIRMATVGDETTYQMTFVENPAAQVKEIGKAIRAAKEKSHHRPYSS